MTSQTFMTSSLWWLMTFTAMFGPQSRMLRARSKKVPAPCNENSVLGVKAASHRTADLSWVAHWLTISAAMCHEQPGSLRWPSRAADTQCGTNAGVGTRAPLRSLRRRACCCGRRTDVLHGRVGLRLAACFPRETRVVKRPERRPLLHPDPSSGVRRCPGSS